MPRTGLSPEEVRQRAVDIAISRIRTDGFARLRIVDVARDMDVSHAALYAHFPNKAALLDAVTESWLEEARQRTARICSLPLPARSRIEAWFVERYRLKLEKVRSDPELYFGFNQATSTARPIIQAHLEKLDGELAGLLAEAGLDPARAAAPLLTGMTAFLHPQVVAERGDGWTEELKTVLDLLLTGLLAARDRA